MKPFFPQAFGHAPTLALALSVFLSVAAFAPGSAWADEDDHERARAAVLRGDILPLTDILDIVREAVPGRFLEAELEHEHHRFIYEIKVMDDHGRITRLDLDAKTGEILKRRHGGED